MALKLSAPEVMGPISTCNKAIRVRNHVVGSSVTIAVDGIEDATSTKVSRWPDDTFKILGPLQQGQNVTAIQRKTGYADSDPSKGIVVQAEPNNLATLTILTHIHECGRRVAAQGAAPGTDIKIMMGNNYSVEAGKGVTINGPINVKYEPGLTANKRLAIVETNCSQISTGTT